MHTTISIGEPWMWAAFIKKLTRVETPSFRA